MSEIYNKTFCNICQKITTHEDTTCMEHDTEVCKNCKNFIDMNWICKLDGCYIKPSSSCHKWEEFV